MARDLLSSQPMKPATSVNELTRHNVELIAKMEKASEGQRALGERVADGFAVVVGGWTFIIVQTVLFVAWIEWRTDPATVRCFQPAAPIH